MLLTSKSFLTSQVFNSGLIWIEKSDSRELSVHFEGCEIVLMMKFTLYRIRQHFAPNQSMLTLYIVFCKPAIAL